MKNLKHITITFNSPVVAVSELIINAANSVDVIEGVESLVHADGEMFMRLDNGRVFTSRRYSHGIHYTFCSDVDSTLRAMVKLGVLKRVEAETHIKRSKLLRIERQRVRDAFHFRNLARSLNIKLTFAQLRKLPLLTP